MNALFIFKFLRIALGLVLLFGLVVGDATPASAALRCYVKADANGLNNGRSWVNAFTSLQSALGTSPCTEVWVAMGTYKPTSLTARMISFTLKSGIKLYGGFAGGETLLSQRDLATNPTILSGEIGVSGSSDNSYHVVVGSGTGHSTLLDGFIITAGNANDTTYPYNAGGGMYNSSGNPTLKNLIFSGNSAGSGGGMSNLQSNPSLANVTFYGNSATWNGGGMYNDNSSPRLTKVTFSGNLASTGGGISNFQYSNPSLVNVTFSGNSATNYGGGISSSFASSPSLTNVTFTGNSASAGGAIYGQGSNPHIKNSILYGDTGGEIANDLGSVTVSYSIVQGGYAGTGNLDADPLLGPLQDNGGFTQTRALGYGSPAIDNGTNTGCPKNDQRGIARPRNGDGNDTAICDMGATESRFVKKPFRSVGTQDGWVLESTETSGVGGSKNSTAETFALGDDAANKQGLSILSFNTRSLPDNAMITGVTLKIKNAGVVGTNPFNTHGDTLVDVRTGAFSGNAALQKLDFEAPASEYGVMIILNEPADGWYSGTMAAADFVNINKAGLTQFRLRFDMDDNDDEGLDYIKFYSGNCATATCSAAYRPQLIIRWYVP